MNANTRANPWPRVRLGELLCKSDEAESLQVDKTYKEVTVRLWGRGVALRGERLGGEIAGKTRNVVRSRQFVFSRIDARNGAFGLIPDDLDGAVVSSDFPVFNMNEDRLIPEFLDLYAKRRSFAEEARRVSKGTTNRVRLKEDGFYRLEIPLPPLPEQKRIVAKVQSLASKIDEARELRERCDRDAAFLLRSSVHRVFAELAANYPPVPFGDFAPHVTSGPRNWRQYYSDSGMRFYRAQDVGPNAEIADGNKQFLCVPDSDQGRSAILEPGDLLVVITGATVGRVAIFSGDDEPGLVNQHVALCRLPRDQINPRYALWGLRSPQGREQLLGQRYGQGKPGLNLGNIRALAIPVPPLQEQKRIATTLDAVEVRHQQLSQIQRKTMAQVEAATPAVLDRAFKGQL
jgi:type I restriction enzyme, S subunit